MKKLAARFREGVNYLRGNLVSLCILWAVVLYACIDVLAEGKLSDEFELAFLPVIGGLAFLSAFFSELALKEKMKWIGIGAGAAVSVTLGLLLRPVLYETAEFTDFYTWRLVYIICGFALILIVLIVFAAWKRSDREFKNFTERSFRNCLLVVTASGIIGILVLVLLLIIAALFDTFFEKALAIAAILTAGLLTIPGCMGALQESESEPGRFFRIIVRLVFPVFEIAAILIGYIYGIRLIPQEHLPSNSIFAVVTWLFVICFFVWLIDDVDSEDHVFAKIRRWIPAAFLPLTLLQGFALYLRIAQYGFTARRYIGLALVVFELVVIGFWMIRRKKLALVLPIGAAFAAILTLLPFTNIPAVERWSEGITWPGNLDDGGSEWDYPDTNYSWFNIYGEDLAPEIDTEGSSRMRVFTIDEDTLGGYNYEIGYQVDYAHVPVVFVGTEEKRELDLSGFLSELIDNTSGSGQISEEELREYCSRKNPAVSGPDGKVYITEMSISIEQQFEDGELVKRLLSQFSLKGVILE